MKKAMAKISKVLAIVLSVLTIMSIMPMQTFATEYQNYQTLTTIDVLEDDDLAIQEEVVSERTANSKTYLLEDGTYCSLSSTTPIHTLENGEWSDFDESYILPETVDEARAMLSNIEATVSNTEVDDGFIISDSDKPISIWGINTKGFTIGTADLSQTSMGLLKIDLNNNALYKKCEVTIKADLRLSCSSTQNDKSIMIKPIY